MVVILPKSCREWAAVSIIRATAVSTHTSTRRSRADQTQTVPAKHGRLRTWRLAKLAPIATRG